MLPKSFKAGKCKTSLKLAVARIKLLKNKREAQLNHMRRDLAQLLEADQEQTARIRVEHVIREEKTMAAYDLIELYCELIVARMPIIESQKKCPIDLKEAISSVVFASPRCADLPELTDVHKHFLAKYGKEFVTSALEVRPECGVSRMVVEKLSARAPDIETKVKVLTAIAREHNVKWDPNAFEEKLQKPNDDLLNGPNTFARASKMPMEPSNVKFSPTPSQNHESATKISENDIAGSSANSNTSAKIGTFSTSIPSTYQPEVRYSGCTETESKSGPEEVKHSYYREKNASGNRQNWNMEFKDATSAAQAAAESAERASMAARAAAEFAIQGNVLHESSTYDTRNEAPEKFKGSKLKGEHIINESVNLEDDQLKGSQGMKSKMQNRQRDGVIQASSSIETESTYDVDGNVRSRSSNRSPSSHSSGTSVHDSILEVNLRKADGLSQRSSSERDAIEQSRQSKKTGKDDLLGEKSDKLHFMGSAASHYTDTYDDDTLWDSNIRGHESDASEDSTIASEEEITESSHKQPISNDHSDVAFDAYVSDTDDRLEFGRYNSVHLLDPFTPHQGEEPFNSSSYIDSWSPKQHGSDFLVKDSSSQLRSAAEPQSAEFSESIREVTLPSQSSDNLAPAFDNSDSEDELDNSTHKEAMEPSISGRGSSSAEAGREFTNSFSDGKKEVEEAKENSLLHVSSYGYSKNQVEPFFSDEPWKRHAPSGLRNSQSSPITETVLSNSDEMEKGVFGILTYNESQPLRSLEVPSIEEAETKDNLGQPLSPSDTENSEFSNNLNYESGQGLNFGRLTGGLKHKGFRRPPYVRSPLVDASAPSKRISDDTPFDTEKPTVSHPEKTLASAEVPDQAMYNQEPHVKDYGSNSKFSRDYLDSEFGEAERLESPRTVGGRASKQRTNDYVTIEKSTISHPSMTSASFEVPKQELHDQKPHGRTYKESSSRGPITYFDLDGVEEEELQTRHTVEKRVNKDVKLSRRTRDLPSDAKKGSLSRFTGRSDVSVVSETESKPSQASSSASKPISNTIARETNSKVNESIKSSHPKSSAEQPSVPPSQTESSARRESPKSPQHSSAQSVLPANSENAKVSSSSRRSASRESSLKSASHVHPKLPDYDALAAHFHSLRSNRR